MARLPLYHRALLEIAEQSVTTVSSEQLAELAGVNAAQVRKDLSYLGSYGTRGVGYEVQASARGVVRDILVKPGQTVESGELLARIEQ